MVGRRGGGAEDEFQHCLAIQVIQYATRDREHAKYDERRDEFRVVNPLLNVGSEHIGEPEYCANDE